MTNLVLTRSKYIDKVCKNLETRCFDNKNSDFHIKGSTVYINIENPFYYLKKVKGALKCINCYTYSVKLVRHLIKITFKNI